MNNLFQIFLCNPEHLNYNLTERAEVFERSRNHFLQDYSHFNYKIYFNEELEQEIFEFDSELYRVYQNILPYAYRADIGRYVLLYKYGGWYFDLNAKPEFYIEPKKDILLWECRSNPHSDDLIENRIIYSQVNKRLFSDCLTAIIKNYKEINYGKNALFITGPGLLKQCFDRLNDSEKNTIEFHTYNYQTSEFKYDDRVFNLNKHCHLVAATLGLNYLHLKGINSYHKMFENRNVYRYTIPKQSPKKKNIASNSKIPRIIHQTFKTDTVPGSIMQSVKSWIDLNPDYEHRFYDDEDIRNYVKNFDCSNFNFSSEQLLSVFDSIIPGAGRADIFRYCVLYQEGGVYTDIDTICVKPLREFIPDDADCVIMINTWYKRAPQHVFGQWFLPYAPQSLIIKDTLELAINSVRTRCPVTSFGKNHSLLELYTGPAVLNEVLFDHFHFKKNKLDYIANLSVNKSIKNRNIKSYFIFYNKDIHAIEKNPNQDANYVIYRNKFYRGDLRNLNLSYWPDQKNIFTS